ncbi:hypothetical protein DYH55_20160 [Methylovirgula sp. 4M-Z18]|uniref:hypothetical protein n=1 Tax=Methylovirgula sp. 4M-Z18 TaxID=2293567 RepID=UPI000E2F685E|nr:hypothetical protein [Methylovirgula sp. 4M-Z18]RFB76457.1 hypothetical protein DYH55_20160 [Methylovirgula sp. 4M-Z18]
MILLDLGETLGKILIRINPGIPRSWPDVAKTLREWSTTITYSPRHPDHQTRSFIGGEFDLGQRSYMLKIYNFMTGALAVSCGTGYAAVRAGFNQQIAGTPLIWVVMLAPPVAT